MPAPRFSPAPDISAEIRFWWHGDAPASVEDWFSAGKPPAKHERRRDLYLDCSDPGRGIKLRGGRHPLEIKTLVDAGVSLSGGLTGQLWVKTRTALAATPEKPVAVMKDRQSLAFDRNAACLASPASEQASAALELGTVQIEGRTDHWTTLAIEAWGDAVQAPRILEAIVRSTRLPTLPLNDGFCGSYPDWLCLDD